MSRPEEKRAAHFGAMAVLVVAGVMDRRTAIDTLLDYESRKPPTAEQKAAWPKGYATARSLARKVESGVMHYCDAELNIAAVIDGGTYTSEAAEQASRLFGRAMAGLDHMRAATAKELQATIEATKRLDDTGPGHSEPHKPAEAAQPLPRGMTSRPVMRPPARP